LLACVPLFAVLLSAQPPTSDDATVGVPYTRTLGQLFATSLVASKEFPLLTALLPPETFHQAYR
jgi:hypothetical protein